MIPRPKILIQESSGTISALEQICRRFRQLFAGSSAA